MLFRVFRSRCAGPNRVKALHRGAGRGIDVMQSRVLTQPVSRNRIVLMGRGYDNIDRNVIRSVLTSSCLRLFSRGLVERVFHIWFIEST